MAILPWGKKREQLRQAKESLRECCQRMDLDEKHFAKSAVEWIARRRWDEDSSEMRRAICLAALTARGKAIEAGHFSPRNERDHEAYSKTQFQELALEEVVRQKIAHFFERLGKVEISALQEMIRAQVERPLIAECLRWAQGNQMKTALALGINRNTLKKKMGEYGITNTKPLRHRR